MANPWGIGSFLGSSLAVIAVSSRLGVKGNVFLTLVGSSAGISLAFFVRAFNSGPVAVSILSGILAAIGFNIGADVYSREQVAHWNVDLILPEIYW